MITPDQNRPTTRYWAWAWKLPVTTGLMQTYIRATDKKAALAWFDANGYEVDNDKIYKAKHTNDTESHDT